MSQDSILQTTRSFNNRLILESYKGDGTPKAGGSAGFATIAQRSEVVGLRILVDIKLTDGTYVKAGSKAFIKESKLIEPWAKVKLESSALQEQFIVADLSFIEFIVP